METIYDQIGHVRGQLVDEADMAVAALATVTRPVDSAVDDTGALREFYVTEMRPFLQKPARSHTLADRGPAADRFAKLRLQVPRSFEPAIVDLESICEEERQLQRQVRIHRVLHAWLLVHVPLSFALMALAVIHIVMALRF